MTSATTWKSLTERSPRQHIGCLVDQGLLVRCPATQGVESDTSRLEVHFGPDQVEGLAGTGAAAQHDLPGVFSYSGALSGDWLRVRRSDVPEQARQRLPGLLA